MRRRHQMFNLTHQDELEPCGLFILLLLAEGRDLEDETEPDGLINSRVCVCVLRASW